MICVEENVDISYKFSGLFLTNEEWIHPKRKIDTYEIIYMQQGTAFIQEEGTSYILKR